MRGGGVKRKHRRVSIQIEGGKGQRRECTRRGSEARGVFSRLGQAFTLGIS